MALLVGQTLSAVALLVAWGGVRSAHASCEPADASNSNTLIVNYGSTTVGCNDLMPLSVVRNAPSVTLTNAAPGRYILFMVDPDAPSTSGGSGVKYFLHWMKEFKFQNGEITDDEVLVDYFPPTPPSGTHRYQFMLYQLGDKNIPDNKIPTQRPSFILDQFVEDENLGDRISTVQFRAQAQA